LLIPLLLTLIALVGAWFLGATTPASLLGYGLVFLAGFVTLYMVYKDARSRQVARQETFSRSLWKTFVRGRRRYGGFIVHLGIVVIGLGVIGSTLFQYETQRTLQLGETLDVQGYRMTFERLDSGQIAEDGRVMDIATLTLSKGDQTYESLRPRRDLFQQSDGSFMPMTIASARSTLAHDFYVLLVGWEELSPDRATFKVYVNPLINLVWWGGMILMLGTVLSVWNPATSPKRATVTNRVKPSAGVVTA
jgi:cytochrome c-type biogenesis protein CcmF